MIRHVVPIGLPLLIAAAFTVALTYSWGFTRAAGIYDLVFGIDAAFARAAGQGHEKGPLYLLSIVGSGPSGWIFLLAAASGAFVAWRRGGPFGRSLVIYALVVCGLHSAVPYKTPWLSLGMWLPLGILCGWTVCALVDTAWRHSRFARGATIASLGALACLTEMASQRQVFADPAGESNPLAYAHTSPDLLRIETLVAGLPGKSPLIAVCLDDPWPLPFLLRNEARVGYWRPGQSLPDAPDLVITTPETAATLDARFAHWRPHFFTQRPGVTLVALEAPSP